MRKPEQNDTTTTNNITKTARIARVIATTSTGIATLTAKEKKTSKLRNGSCNL